MKPWERDLLDRLRRRPLKLGAAGLDVDRWRARLRRKGFEVAAKGRFDLALRNATMVAQAWAGVAGDGLVGPVTWTAVGAKQGGAGLIPSLQNLARPRVLDCRYGRNGYPIHHSKRWATRDASQITMKVGHYTGGPASFLADASFHVRSGYLDDGGAPAIAYHLGVDKDGTLLVFNHWNVVVWHCDGGRNTDTLGIVFRGASEGPNAAQKRTLRWLWRQLEGGAFQPFKSEPPWPRVVRSSTHRHIRSTSCPGEKGEAFYLSISARFET